MKRRLVLVCIAGAVAALATHAFMPTPVRIVYNPSNSMQRGWYLISEASTLQAGDAVLASLPAGAATMAAQRHYLPARVPLLKRVGAVVPQRVCIRERVVYVDGAVVATALVQDGLGRSLPAWPQCRALVDGEVFLLNIANPASFDSRYFGPIDAAVVAGRATPLWTWNAP